MAKHSMETSASTDQLKQDLRHLSETVEELVNATAKDASGEMRDLRDRAEKRLKETRSRLESRGEHLYDNARQNINHQADACDRYVHDHPWTSIGIGAAGGMIIGMLLGRR